MVMVHGKLTSEKRIKKTILAMLKETEFGSGGVLGETYPDPVGPFVKLFHMEEIALVDPGFCSMKLAFFASMSEPPELRF